MKKKIRPYAQACFELLDPVLLPKAIACLQRLKEAAQLEPNLYYFLLNPLIPKEQKLELVSKICSDFGEQGTLNKLFSLLADKKSLDLIFELPAALQEIYQKAEGIIEIELISAQSLNQLEELSNLKQALAQALNTKIKLQTKQDPTLISGVILQTKDHLLDNSLKGHLQRLKQIVSKA